MDDDLGVALFQETSIFIHILVLKPMVLGILSSFEKHPRVLFEWFGHIFSHLLAFWWSWNPDESWKFVSHQTSVWSIWHPTVNGIANEWFDCRNTVLRRLAVRNLNRTWVESSDDELGMCYVLCITPIPGMLCRFGPFGCPSLLCIVALGMRPGFSQHQQQFNEFPIKREQTGAQLPLGLP